MRDNCQSPANFRIMFVPPSHVSCRYLSPVITQIGVTIVTGFLGATLPVIFIVVQFGSAPTLYEVTIEDSVTQGHFVHNRTMVINGVVTVWIEFLGRKEFKSC